MIPRGENSIICYWDDKKSSLIKNIDNINEYVNRKLDKQTCWQKFCDFINFFGKDSEIVTKPLFDFLDQIASTNFETETPFNTSFVNIKKNITEYKEALISKENQPEAQIEKQTDSLRQLNRELRKIHLQVKANKLISQGRYREFNGLKKNSPGTAFYIRNLNINNKTLEDLDLEKCIFENVTFNGSKLVNVKAKQAEFIDCHFISDSSIEGADFEETIFNKVDFADSSILDSDFERVIFDELTLNRSELSGSDFKSCTFNQLKLENYAARSKSKTNFDNSKFAQADFVNSDLRNFKITDSEFDNLNFNNSNLIDSELENIGFENSQFDQFDLRNSSLIGVNFENCDLTNYTDAYRRATDYKPRVELGSCCFDNCRLSNSDYSRFDIQNTEFKNSDLEALKFTTSYLNDIDFYGSQINNSEFSFGKVQDQNINFHDSNYETSRFEFLDQSIEDYHELNNRLITIRDHRTSKSDKQELLFKYPKSFQGLSLKEIRKYSGVSTAVQKRLEPDLAQKIKNGEDQETLIHRLHVMHKAKVMAQALAPPSRHKKVNHQLQKLFYDSAKTPAKTQKLESVALKTESEVLKGFDDEICGQVSDSLDEVSDYLLIPRIKELYPEMDVASISSSKLDKVTRFLQPHLALAITEARDYSKIPKSAPFKSASLLLNLSNDIHNPRVNFTGFIRDFSPQGGWKKILDQKEKFVIIRGQDGKQYKVLNLLNTSQFKAESDELGHCIGRSMTYANKAKKGTHHYFSIQEAATGKRVSTLELELKHKQEVGLNFRKANSIKNSNYILVKRQNEGNTGYGREPKLAKEIATKFLKKIANGDVKVHTPDEAYGLGEIASQGKITNFENHIGTRVGIDPRTDRLGVRRIMRLAWARLARPEGVFLDNKFGKSERSFDPELDLDLQEIRKLKRGIEILGKIEASILRAGNTFSDEQSKELEELRLSKINNKLEELDRLLKEREKTRAIQHSDSESIKSTMGIGSYKQAKDAPFDNYFIPNCFRGEFIDGSFVEFKSKSLDTDEDGVDRGIEKFFTSKIPSVNKSLDDLIKKAVKLYDLI